MKKLIPFIYTGGAFMMIYLLSCNATAKKEDKETQDGNKTVELHVPDTLRIDKTSFTGEFDSAAIAAAPLKIYAAINFSCPTCIERIEKWRDLSPVLTRHKVPLILICHSEDKFALMKYLCESGKIKDFPYPFYLDDKEAFVRKNKAISNSAEMNAVLTDNKNNIILEGDPLNSSETRSLFIGAIEKSGTQ